LAGAYSLGYLVKASSGLKGLRVVVFRRFDAEKDVVEAGALDWVQVKIYFATGAPSEQKNAATQLRHSKVESIGFDRIGTVACKAKLVFHFDPVAGGCAREGASDIFDD
jgi:hypothetical protein